MNPLEESHTVMSLNGADQSLNYPYPFLKVDISKLPFIVLVSHPISKVSLILLHFGLPLQIVLLGNIYLLHK